MNVVTTVNVQWKSWKELMLEIWRAVSFCTPRVRMNSLITTGIIVPVALTLSIMTDLYTLATAMGLNRSKTTLVLVYITTKYCQETTRIASGRFSLEARHDWQFGRLSASLYQLEPITQNIINCSCTVKGETDFCVFQWEEQPPSLS